MNISTKNNFLTTVKDKSKKLKFQSKRQILQSLSYGLLKQSQEGIVQRAHFYPAGLRFTYDKTLSLQLTRFQSETMLEDKIMIAEFGES